MFLKLWKIDKSPPCALLWLCTFRLYDLVHRFFLFFCGLHKTDTRLRNGCLWTVILGCTILFTLVWYCLLYFYTFSTCKSDRLTGIFIKRNSKWHHSHIRRAYWRSFRIRTTLVQYQLLLYKTTKQTIIRINICTAAVKYICVLC